MYLCMARNTIVTMRRRVFFPAVLTESITLCRAQSMPPSAITSKSTLQLQSIMPNTRWHITKNTPTLLQQANHRRAADYR